MDNVGVLSERVASVLDMKTDDALEQAFRDIRRMARDPQFLRTLSYDAVDDRYRGAPAGEPAAGPVAVAVLLEKAMVALDFADREEARGFVLKASRVPAGARAPAPFLLNAALRLLGESLFRAVEAERSEHDHWLSELRAGLERPGDDITLVALGAMQAVAAAYPLWDGVRETIADCVEEYAGAEPGSPVARVLAGSSHEPDLVLDVLRLAKSLRDLAQDCERDHEWDQHQEEDGEEDGEEDDREAGDGPR